MNRIIPGAGCFGIALLFVGCVSSPRFTMDRKTPNMPVEVRPVTHDQQEEGVASYYAEEFNGRQTSNGETYDMNAMTAAHRTLPFNSKVQVTNLVSGKSVVVRINDRGPFKSDRIIDLSLAAAKAIEMIGTGTAKVRLDVIAFGDSTN
ncbi:MAG TPA: septal ring lytic transglycosylase RlpA family protein [Bacteroidota bacterium]|nr:septal ring lytic transglycosylase RlpA family protein [Bacteroidota bacterium]